MRTTIIALTLLAAFAGTSAARSSAEAGISAGDREHRTMRAEAALAHY